MKKLLSLLIISLITAGTTQQTYAIEVTPYVAGTTALVLNASAAALTALTAQYVKSPAASLTAGVVLGVASFAFPLIANKAQTYFGGKKSSEQGLYLFNGACNMAFLGYLYTYGANVLKNHPTLEYYAIGGTIASSVAGVISDNGNTNCH